MRFVASTASPCREVKRAMIELGGPVFNEATRRAAGYSLRSLRIGAEKRRRLPAGRRATFRS